MGRIGRDVAKLAAGIRYARHGSRTRSFRCEVAWPAFRWSPWRDVLKRVADFVSLHVPLDDENRGLMGREQLEHDEARRSYLAELSAEAAWWTRKCPGRSAGSRDTWPVAALDTYSTEPPGGEHRSAARAQALAAACRTWARRPARVRFVSGWSWWTRVAKAVKRFMSDRAARHRLAAEKEEAEAAAAAESRGRRGSAESTRRLRGGRGGRLLRTRFLGGRHAGQERSRGSRGWHVSTA